MLSKENYEKLDANFLYKKEPIRKDNYTDTYWCKNWTFIVRKCDDGRAYMLDTYFKSWDSHRIQVTDDNINEFEIVFDFRDVERISDHVVYNYEKDDLFRVATDSGGYKCGKLYWIKKGTPMSKRLLIENKKSEINSLKRQLEWAESELKKLESETKL